MSSRKFIGLILLFLFAVPALSGCGGGGGSGNSGMTIDLKATKGVALADGNDVVTVRAKVENPDGTAAPDGTSVSFTAADSSGPLPSSTAVTSKGTATFSLI